MNRPMSDSRFLPFALFVLLTATACVAQDAGYADTRRSLRRFHVDARWQAVDGDARGGEDNRQLLAQPLDADRAVRVAMLNNADVQSASRSWGSHAPTS